MWFFMVLCGQGKKLEVVLLVDREQLMTQTQSLTDVISTFLVLTCNVEQVSS